MYALLTSRAIVGEIYNRLTAGGDAWAMRYFMKITSRQAIETYGWLGMVPAMREWIGGRDPKKLREFTWAVANKDFEGTLEVLVSELRRDASGQLMIRIAEFARRALSHPTKLMTQKIIDAEATACYDGSYFFHTAHSEGDSGSWDNDKTSAAATGTTPTVQEMRDAILGTIQAILGFKDDQGEPMNDGARDFEVMVPILYWAVGLQALGAQTLGGGETNVLASMDGFNISLRANSRLTWTTKFATFRLDGDTKPFILQEEVPLNVSSIAEGSEEEFKNKRHLYGVDWSGNVDYGFPQHACLHTFT